MKFNNRSVKAVEIKPDLKPNFVRLAIFNCMKNQNSVEFHVSRFIAPMKQTV